MAAGEKFDLGHFQGFDNEGKVVPYGKVYFTDSFTGAAILTYKDSELSVVNTHPVILTASGKADIFLRADTYDIVFTDALDESIWSIEDYTPSGLDVNPTSWRQRLVSEADQTIFTFTNPVLAEETIVYTNGVLQEEGVDEDYTMIGTYANVLYDDTNIVTEFTTLTNVITTNDELEATGYDGVATADDIGDGSTLLKALTTPFESKFEFANISDVTSTADTLETDTPILDGDNLIIVKDDDSIHEVVASGVVSATGGLATDTHTTYIATSGTVSSNNEFSGRESWKAFDGLTTLSNKWRTNSGVAGTLTYAFASSLKIVEFRFYTPLSDGGAIESARQPRNFTVQTSDNGTAWTTIETIVDYTEKTSVGWLPTFTLTSPVTASYFRFDITSNWGDAVTSIQEVQLIQSGSSTMDTTATTAGQTPSRVYAVDAQPSFNFGSGFVDAVKNNDTYAIDVSDVLSTTREYDTIEDLAGSVTITPKVTLKSIGDKMTELKAQVFQGSAVGSDVYKISFNSALSLNDEVTAFGAAPTVTSNVLLSDGSIPMDDGYLPEGDEDIVNKDYADNYIVTAWADFDGTVATPVVNDSRNIATIVKNAVGSYTVTFAVAMDSIYYSAVGNSDLSECHISVDNKSTTGFNLYNKDDTDVAQDDNIDFIVVGGKA